MSKFKHTPGPWKIIRDDRGLISSIGKTDIAFSHADDVWLDVTEEDAKLIATAPEMLEALILAYKSNMEACDDIGGCPYECNNNHCEICIHSKNEIQLKTIIEKATGMPIEEVLKNE